MNDARRRADFLAAGFTVLTSAFDAAPLTLEVDRALADGFRHGTKMNTGSAQNQFRYVPMMCERTPVSVWLISELAPVAATLLGRPVLPVRAKGTEYFGETAWHRDSDLPALASVGLVAYLDDLDEASGALRLLRSSHTSPPTAVSSQARVLGSAGEAVPTARGDIIAFDERLWHASRGGRTRRQWRIDFVIDPVTAPEEELVRAYFAGIFQPGWDGGYDVDRYPTYGSYWQDHAPLWSTRLKELGALQLALAEEEAVRALTGPSGRLHPIEGNRQRKPGGAEPFHPLSHPSPAGNTSGSIHRSIRWDTTAGPRELPGCSP